MLLEKEVEGVLQVLITVDEDFVILVQIIYEILNKEEIVRVEGRELYRGKVSTMRLSVLLSCLYFWRRHYNFLLLNDHGIRLAVSVHKLDALGTFL